MSTLREISKEKLTAQARTVEIINAGSLQRIADVCEMMCRDREKLESDYNYMRESRDGYRADLEKMQRRYNALKGVITKMKKKQIK